jgi:hypothetical protein
MRSNKCKLSARVHFCGAYPGARSPVGLRRYCRDHRQAPKWIPAGFRPSAALGLLRTAFRTGHFPARRRSDVPDWQRGSSACLRHVRVGTCQPLFMASRMYPAVALCVPVDRPIYRAARQHRSARTRAGLSEPPNRYLHCAPRVSRISEPLLAHRR